MLYQGKGGIIADRYCRNCGHTLRTEFRFCPNCGTARPSPCRTEAKPAPTFTPEDILASLEEAKLEQAAEAPPYPAPMDETARASPPQPDAGVPQAASDPVALPPKEQAVEDEPEASEANSGGYRANLTIALLIGTLFAAMGLGAGLGGVGSAGIFLAVVALVRLVQWGRKQRQSLADTSPANTAQEPPRPLPRATGGAKPLDEVPYWARLLGLLFTGALFFGLFRFLGFSSEVSFVIAVVLLALAGLGAGRNKRIVRPAPTQSRSVPQWVKIAVATRDGGKYRRCGSAYDLQYDHIIPYSHGGSSTDVNNIQLLCGRCNRLKSNRYVG